MANKESALKKVDGSKLNVLQEGFIGEPPFKKEKKPEIITDDEQKARGAYIACLKKCLRPQKLNLSSLPEHDREAMCRKLDKMQLATLNRFFTGLSPEVLKAIEEGNIENLEPEVIAELNFKYKDISP